MLLGTKIKRQVGFLLTAWMYFTRVPLPAYITNNVNYSQYSLEKCTRYLPLVGIVTGAAAGLVFLGADWLFESKPVAVILSMIASILLTGAFHEDGLTDFFDAFGGGWWSKERILEIMKDSRVGTFGSLALIMALLLKFQCLLAVDSGALLVTLVAAHAFSRFTAASFTYTSAYVRENDQSYFKPIMKERMQRSDFLIAALIGIAPTLLLGDWRFLLLLPLLWGVRVLFGRWFTGKIGGYTGDCLGATQQIVEICFYLGVIAMGRFIS
ncbi:MAG TPA: adenosylcobinamide-GDP ribazoletransferase [Patescibacteria group bacterium]|nr:adenosylcobinamide-GDP ribazoletransferase [Patescibacteria group bacterium]